jgi:hypothetical protein
MNIALGTSVIDIMFHTPGRWQKDLRHSMFYLKEEL